VPRLPEARQGARHAAGGRAGAAGRGARGVGGEAGGKSKPSRFWTDAREKAAQVSVLVARLARYDARLPVASAARGGGTGGGSGGGGLARATRLLHAPLPTDARARAVVEAVRRGLLDAREVALESLEAEEAVVRASALAAIDARHAKLVADCRLIEVRREMVAAALDSVETDPASLRVLFEVTQIIKAQVKEAGP
jgi:hypothetical protein